MRKVLSLTMLILPLTFVLAKLFPRMKRRSGFPALTEPARLSRKPRWSRMAGRCPSFSIRIPRAGRQAAAAIASAVRELRAAG